MRALEATPGVATEVLADAEASALELPLPSGGGAVAAAATARPSSASSSSHAAARTHGGGAATAVPASVDDLPFETPSQQQQRWAAATIGPLV